MSELEAKLRTAAVPAGVLLVAVIAFVAILGVWLALQVVAALLALWVMKDAGNYLLATLSAQFGRDDDDDDTGAPPAHSGSVSGKFAADVTMH